MPHIRGSIVGALLGLLLGCSQHARSGTSFAPPPAASASGSSPERSGRSDVPRNAKAAASTAPTTWVTGTPAQKLGEAAANALFAQDGREALRLIEAGADPNFSYQDSSGYLLYLATFSPDMLVVVKALVARGADPNHRCMAENTPLLNASDQAGADMVEFLIASGGDVRIADRHGYAAIHYAVIGANFGHGGGAATIKLLLDHGADINHRNDVGKTPLDVAENLAVQKFLISNGAKRGADLPATR